MFKIRTYNKIAVKGLNEFDRETYEISSEMSEPDAFVLRSHKLHEETLPKNLKAIARAGAGVNNVPVEKCTEAGIVVFNAPGANANAVKELVLAGMLLSSRDIYGGLTYVSGLKGQNVDVSADVEKNKSNFSGYELKGKQLGVIGLGAIGLMVANTAISLGMKVMGYDPFLSVNSAWELSSQVQKAPSLEKMLKTSDFITIHVPYTEDTKQFFTKERLETMKKGSVLLNFSRDGLVDQDALLGVLESGDSLAKYVTDFPNDKLLTSENIISIPHLGASTVEAEENCAIMVAKQLKDFLENGNIKNSVNFPACELEREGQYRLIVANKNVPNIISQITTLLAEKNLNIVDMVNKSRGDLAYSIVDFDGPNPNGLVEKVAGINGVIMSRLL